MNKALLFLILLLVASSFTFAQNYSIKVKINGVSDTVLYLGHHFGKQKLVIDTARIDSKGIAVFDGDRILNKGIYLVVMPSLNMTYFEILVSDDKFFEISTDTSDFVNMMKVKGSKENIAFNKYQRQMGIFQQQSMDLENLYKSQVNDSLAQASTLSKFKELNAERVKYIDQISAKNNGTFFSKILLSMKEPDIPESPKDADGNEIDPHFGYKYYKAHYWDYIDWSENGLIRTPIFEPKIDYYFDKMLVPLPDSMIPEARRIINWAYESNDSLMFQYVLAHVYSYFVESKVMGFDQVYADIGEEWYLSGKAWWADTAFLNKLRPEVVRVSKNPLGSIAPELKRIQTIDDRYISLHQFNSEYTILVFYEPHCGHCKKEIPELMQHFRDSLKSMNVKVIAFYTQYDREEWKTFLDEKNLYEEGWINVWDGPYPHCGFRETYNMISTPYLLLLDKDKKIIAKRITLEGIKSFIEYEERRKNQ